MFNEFIGVLLCFFFALGTFGVALLLDPRS
jgi:hypothetical protein